MNSLYIYISVSGIFRKYRTDSYIVRDEGGGPGPCIFSLLTEKQKPDVVIYCNQPKGLAGCIWRVVDDVRLYSQIQIAEVARSRFTGFRCVIDWICLLWMPSLFMRSSILNWIVKSCIDAACIFWSWAMRLLVNACIVVNLTETQAKKRGVCEMRTEERKELNVRRNTVTATNSFVS